MCLVRLSTGRCGVRAVIVIEFIQIKSLGIAMKYLQFHFFFFFVLFCTLEKHFRFGWTEQQKNCSPVWILSIAMLSDSTKEEERRPFNYSRDYLLHMLNFELERFLFRTSFWRMSERTENNRHRKGRAGRGASRGRKKSAENPEHLRFYSW